MAQPISRFETWRAFAVHLLTASGALWAFLSIISAAEQRWLATFAWLGLALFVDGIDGPLARRIDITRVLPNWSGDLLDAIVDYVTYVIIPAFALYQADLIDPPLAFIASALIVTTSALYYADMQMKSKDYFFIGFPVAWNMVAFTFFAVRPGSTAAFVFVLFCSVATFLPIKFLHPVRVKRMRPLNLSVLALWSALGLTALFMGFETPLWLKAGLIATGLYLFSIGGILQLVDKR
jgi:phosphatidylcholine synthase